MLGRIGDACAGQVFEVGGLQVEFPDRIVIGNHLSKRGLVSDGKPGDGESDAVDEQGNSERGRLGPRFGVFGK